MLFGQQPGPKDHQNEGGHGKYTQNLFSIEEAADLDLDHRPFVIFLPWVISSDICMMTLVHLKKGEHVRNEKCRECQMKRGAIGHYYQNRVKEGWVKEGIYENM